MESARINRTPTWIMAPVVNAMLLLGEFARRRQMKASCGSLTAEMLRDIGLTPMDVGRTLDDSRLPRGFGSHRRGDF